MLMQGSIDSTAAVAFTVPAGRRAKLSVGYFSNQTTDTDEVVTYWVVKSGDSRSASNRRAPIDVPLNDTVRVFGVEELDLDPGDGIHVQSVGDDIVSFDFSMLLL